MTDLIDFTRTRVRHGRGLDDGWVLQRVESFGKASHPYARFIRKQLEDVGVFLKGAKGKDNVIIPDPFPGWGTLGGEKMSLPDMTTMCPKHGIAHGVCVDPIKTIRGSTTSEPGYVKPSVTGEPAQHIPCSTENESVGYPTVGRPMTVEDGEAGELVVKLRNLVADLRGERRRMAGRLADLLDPDIPCPRCRDQAAPPDESVGDCCPECGGYVFNPETTPPNRFDPFEALDDIEQWLDGSTSAHVAGIRAYLRALRAYITGMER